MVNVQMLLLLLLLCLGIFCLSVFSFCRFLGFVCFESGDIMLDGEGSSGGETHDQTKCMV